MYNQTTTDIVLKRGTCPQEGPSGVTPEEGIVIMGDGSSMHVILPEALPVGWDMEVEDSELGDLDPL